ncbi:MAG: hypothetical protein PUE33_00485 [bacterium]|nr:hypothetical protein [bacterium]
MKKQSKLSRILIFFQKLFKRIKLRNLLMLAILMSCNSFAWFIYATKVSNNITAHVRSWNVNFIVGDNNIEETLTFDVESVYPGMPDSLQVINATNNSDTSATLSYEIVSASILGEEYVVSDTLTSAELTRKIENDYPFKLKVEIDNGNMTANGGTAQIKFSLTWPFESGDDELDTEWGHKAYVYHENNPDSKSITLVIKVTAIQVND